MKEGKKNTAELLSLMLATGVTACSPDRSQPAPKVSGQPDGNENPGGGNPTDPNTDNMNMVLKTGSATFTATLAENETAKAFRSLLPMTITLNELNGNEKYYDLPNSLPTAATSPGTIRSGDIMLYGSRTLVLFYRTFSTTYSYTRIGTVDNPAGLESALGTRNIAITFELKND